MKLTKVFRGVPDGEIYPVEYNPGDVCPPELMVAARELGALGDVKAPTADEVKAPESKKALAPDNKMAAAPANKAAPATAAKKQESK